jgi:hypothetical protein
MDQNYVALVPSFKSNGRPTFVLACDALGLEWLVDRFTALTASHDASEFSIGDGNVFASDDRCNIQVRRGKRSLITRLHGGSYLWTVRDTDAQQTYAQLESLRAASSPGHQYVELRNGDYQTVVVTKGEYPTTVLRSMCRASAGA